jgi:hypothetical protein
MVNTLYRDAHHRDVILPRGPSVSLVDRRPSRRSAAGKHLFKLMANFININD